MAKTRENVWVLIHKIEQNKERKIEIHGSIKSISRKNLIKIRLNKKSCIINYRVISRHIKETGKYEDDNFLIYKEIIVKNK